jgi:predicted alpha/beta-hydrolase family hydrolase
VLRFEFPYMARMRETGRRQGPDWMQVLQQAFRERVRLERAATPERPLFIGGKSMGGRVASLLVDELAVSEGVRGCLCLGYPFHPPGKPLQLRTEHLAVLQTPTLILQGERDPFGRREEVEHYPLSRRVQMEWMASGDHSFKPTRSSGMSESENWAAAVNCSDRFLQVVLGA